MKATANPWATTIFEGLRNFARFVLWLCVAIDCLIVGLFSIAFTY